MDIATASVYEHEIAKNDDFQFGFESVIRNTALLDRMLVSAESDYIVGGAISPAPDTLALCVGRLWGNGLSFDLPVFNAAAAGPIPLAAPVEDNRVDTLQARGVLEEYDTPRRAFFDPETSGGNTLIRPPNSGSKSSGPFYRARKGRI
jgi:hypothetical protein